MRAVSEASVRHHWSYRIAGLHVQSDFPLNGSIALDAQTSAPDIVIRIGDVPATLENAVTTGPNWQSAPSAFLLDVPGVVRFLVTAGSEIVVAPAIAIADAAIFVMGTGLAIALFQRGTLVLHASAVIREDHAFAFCGPSGAGKSTLAALLCLDGACAMLSDDVSAIDFNGARPALRADGRRISLWEDVIDALGLTDRRGMGVRSTLNKYHVDFPPYGGGDAPALRAIYLLAPLPEGSEPTFQRLPFGRAAFALDRNGYRPLLSRQIGERARKLEQMAQLVGQVPVYLFSRSPAPPDNARSLSALKAHWASLT